MDIASTSTLSPPPGASKKRKDITRSRTGCGVCKGRRKKCDESWREEDGSCLRCHRGGFQCVSETARPSRSRSGRALSSPAGSNHSPSTSDLQQVVAIRPDNSGNLNFYLPDYTLPAASTSVNFEVDYSLLDLLGDIDPGASGLDHLPALINPLSGSMVPHEVLGDSTATHSVGWNWSDALGNAAGNSGNDMASDAIVKSQVDPALVEIRDFAEEWWSYYNSLNDSYFYSIPKKARDVVKLFMRDEMMGPGNDLGRAGVSAWCSSHYSMTMLKEGHHSFQEWDEKAARYYQQTLSLLYDKSFALSARIGAILDLRLAQINRHGAAPAYFLLLAGEAFLRDALGERPNINFAQAFHSKDLAFRDWAYSDVLRTVVLRKRSTFYNLTNTPSNANEQLPFDGPVANRRTLNIHLGLPVELLLGFADISNAIVEMDRLGHVSRARDQIANAIEERIKSYEPDMAMVRSMGCSSYFLSEMASIEMWRHAALIYLYCSLLCMGPLAKRVRNSLAEIIQLSNSLVDTPTSLPSIFVKASRACVWFLAGTVAVTEEDREHCRDGLVDCGDGKLFKENLRALERFWVAVDDQGIVPDWREFVERERLEVCFL